MQPLYFDHPAWHPASEWIVVEHGDSVDSNNDSKLDAYFGGIWLVNVETGATQPLLRGFTLPAWSPDGKKLALVRGAQIYTIDVVSLDPVRVDSSSLRQLTFEGRNFFPAWSPDGQWIAYDNTICGSAVEPPPPNSCGILILNYEGQNQRFISRGRFPDWLPDGNYLLYVGLYNEIYQININDTSQIAKLTSLNQVYIYATDNRYPKYSHDGTKIAFYSQPRVGPPAIWVMNSDGSNIHKLSSDYAQQFDWSPDGQRIAFIFWNFFEAVPGNGQIWLINVDGTGLKQLTFFQRRR
ncbi:DPP IV N-terminal domain-containing protein [candidate division KSB1 bacterium]|nr:DPP IV N-terminal domain-containing protein [candidate division KSB1 bacterium]